MNGNGSKGYMQVMVQTINAMTGLDQDTVLRQSIILGLANMITCPEGDKSPHLFADQDGLSYTCIEKMKGHAGATETVPRDILLT